MRKYMSMTINDTTISAVKSIDEYGFSPMGIGQKK